VLDLGYDVFSHSWTRSCRRQRISNRRPALFRPPRSSNCCRQDGARCVASAVVIARRFAVKSPVGNPAARTFHLLTAKKEVALLAAVAPVAAGHPVAMTRFGYTLMTEQNGPRDLVRYAVSAEERGFDFEVCSDRTDLAVFKI
jgi:hypothetical protein